MRQHWQTLYFLWSVHFMARIDSWIKVCDKHIVEMNFLHPIKENLTDSVVMWDTLHQESRMGLCQDSDLAGDLTDTKSLPREERSAFLVVAHLYKLVGLVRCRQPFHTVAPEDR